MQSLLPSGVGPLLTYYACAAVTIYVVLGRFSSPNKRLRKLKLKDLEKIEADNPPAEVLSDNVPLNAGRPSSSSSRHLAAGQQQVSSPSSEPVTPAQVSSSASSSPSASPERKGTMKRKLSFLATSGVISNPFMNNTWEISRPERLKCALCGPVLIPPRLALLFISLMGAYGFGTLSTLGAELERPLARWRIELQRPMKLFARGIMFALGYHWISVKGKKVRGI